MWLSSTSYAAVATAAALTTTAAVTVAAAAAAAAATATTASAAIKSVHFFIKSLPVKFSYPLHAFTILNITSSHQNSFINCIYPSA